MVDYMEGFVDIHNHILPGIDDGAKTVEDSIDLINGFSSIGITNFICTPHIMHNYYDNTPKTIKKSFKKLKKALEEQKIKDVRVAYAAEHMIDDNFENILERRKVMPLGTDHLLVEMSFLQPPIHFYGSIEKVTSAGYFPVLAHPERYRFLNGNFQKYSSYKKRNILFQVNLLSLAGYYGKNVKSTAGKLIDNGFVDFLGSDVHSLEQLNYLKNTVITGAFLKKIHPLIDKTITSFS